MFQLMDDFNIKYEQCPPDIIYTKILELRKQIVKVVQTGCEQTAKEILGKVEGI